MADFRARILAELDDSQVPAQLRDIERRNHFNLNDIRVGNANQLISRIQDVLDHHNFNINLNGISTTNIVRQMQQAGTNAGQNFTNGFRTGMGELNTTLRNGVYEIQRMWDTLSNANFSTADINAITQDLDQLNIAVSNVVHRIDEAGNVRLTVRGVDELNRNITTIREFNRATGEIHQVFKTIGQEFNIGEEAAREFREEVNIAYTTMMNIRKQIGSLQKQRIGLDVESDADQLRVIEVQIRNLAAEYIRLHTVFGEHLAPTQIANLDRVLENSTLTLERMRAQAVDTGRALADIVRDHVNTGDIAASISKVEDRYRQLGITGHTALSNVRDDIEELHYLQIMMSRDNIGANRLVDSYEEYETVLKRVQNRLSVITNETKSSMKLVQTAYSNMTSTAKSITVLSKQKVGLDPENDAKKLSALDAEIKRMLDYYNDAMNVFGDNFTDTQKAALKKIFDDANGQISVLNSGLADTKENLAKKIRGYVDTSNISKSVSDVTTQYNRLSAVGGKKLDGVKADIAELNRLHSILSNKDTSVDKLVDTYEEFCTVLSKVKNDLGVVSNETKGFVDAFKITKLSGDMEVWLKKNTKAASTYGKEIQVLIKRLNNLDENSEDSAESLERIRHEFELIKNEARAAGKTGASFLSQFEDVFGRMLRYISATELIHEGVQAAREMANAVYDIDTAMTELRKVTDETSGRYGVFMDTSASSAKELGRSISSLIEQSANWTKLGYSLDEAEELSKISSIYANVADVDNDTAVSDMVTAMKAYNIEAENAVTIVDRLNKLSNEYAVTAAGLGQGLSRSASTMATAGTDLSKTLAIITGISEITQSPEEAGNFLKTSVARLQGMKGVLEELGEEVDESVDSISKVQTQILNLTGGKVNIFDGNGEFRDYYNVMEEIAAVVDDLESTDRAQLYEILFGKNRMNQGAAMLQAFQSGQIQKALKAALGSAGSASAEQQKWMESLEARIGTFRAAWQELSQVVMDSNFLKSIVDTGTGLLEVLTKIATAIDDLHAGPTVIAGIVAAFASFKNVGRDKLFSLF